MKIESSQISANQFMFSVACFIQASSLLASFFSSISKQDSWIAAIGGFLASMPFLLIFILLIRHFPGSNLIQINDRVFGKVIGKLASLLYLWFFLTLASLNLRDLGDFVTRYSTAFVFISLGVVVFTSLLTLNRMDFNHFLPVFSLPPIKYVQSINIVTTIPMGEIVVFLMIAPSVNDQKNIPKTFFWGLVIGELTLLAIILRDTAVLGNTMPLFSLPSFETLRVVSISEAISRVEVLFAIVLIILLFFKVALLYYVIVLATAQLFQLSTFRPLVLTIGAIIVSYAFILFPSSVEHATVGRDTAPIFWLVFELLLPLCTLIVAKVRKIPKQKEVAAT